MIWWQCSHDKFGSAIHNVERLVAQQGPRGGTPTQRAHSCCESLSMPVFFWPNIGWHHSYFSNVGASMSSVHHDNLDNYWSSNSTLDGFKSLIYILVPWLILGYPFCWFKIPACYLQGRYAHSLPYYTTYSDLFLLGLSVISVTKFIHFYSTIF